MLPSYRQALNDISTDHGVTDEGVSAYGQEVTEEMAVNVAMGSAASTALARGAGSDLWVIFVGIRRPVRHHGVWLRKVGLGSGNIAQGPAMAAEEVDASLEVEWQTAVEAVGQVCDLLEKLGIGHDRGFEIVESDSMR